MNDTLNLYIGTGHCTQLHVAPSLEIAKQKHKEFIQGFYPIPMEIKEEELKVFRVKTVDGYNVLLDKMKITNLKEEL